MTRRMRDIVWSAVAWVAVGLFWLVVTRSFHPNFALDVVVTVALISAYAAATYINHLVLIPLLQRTREQRTYLLSLLGTMIVLTAIALTIIRMAYYAELGPDPDPLLSIAKHFAIDLFGMAVHVGAAAIIVWYVKKVRLATASA